MLPCGKPPRAEGLGRMYDAHPLETRDVLSLMIAATLLGTALACSKAPEAAGGTKRLSLAEVKTTLAGATGTAPDLSQADLRGLDLSGLDFKRANLTKAQLARARLVKANLFRCDLTDAVLSDADLRDANLDGTVLRRANLQRANLEGASLFATIVEQAISAAPIWLAPGSSGT